MRTITHMVRRATQRFDMRLTPAMNDALTELAKREGVSKAAFLKLYIERQAKKQKIPTWRWQKI